MPREVTVDRVFTHADYMVERSGLLMPLRADAAYEVSSATGTKVVTFYDAGRWEATLTPGQATLHARRGCPRGDTKILDRYSPDAERERLISDIVSLHDLGKTSPAFQKYIRDPSGYRGARNRKAHTPVGFTAALLLGERRGRDSFWKLCVSAAVLGHHSGFPNANRLTDHFLLGDEWARIIDGQAAAIPASEVSELTGFLSKRSLRTRTFAEPPTMRPRN
jgi:CRISPR-associated endonuclease Cas3-HD